MTGPLSLLEEYQFMRGWLLHKYALNGVFFSLFSATCLCMALGTYFLMSISFFDFVIAVSLGWCSQGAASFVCILLLSLSKRKEEGKKNSVSHDLQVRCSYLCDK